MDLTLPPDQPVEKYGLFRLGSKPETPLKITVDINGQPVEMEVDTGASLSVVSETTFRWCWPGVKLLETSIQLRTYTGEPVRVKGQVRVDIAYKGQAASQVALLVIEGDGPNLLGRDWLQFIRLDWPNILQLQGTQSLRTVLHQNQEAFKEGLGTMKGVTAKLYVESSVQPRFCKARTVPFAMRQKVEKELLRLQ